MATASNNLNYDDLLKAIGEFGRFQKRTFLTLTVIYAVAALNTMGYLFWAARPDHWCDVAKPTHLLNISDEQWKSAVIPSGDKSECYYYNRNWENYTVEDLEDGTQNATEEGVLMQCSKWKYDTSQYVSTVVTQMNLVCDRFWLRSVSQAVFLVFKGIGLLFFGPLSDRFERRRTVLWLAPLQAVSTLALCFTGHVYLFIALRALQAATLYGIEISAYCILMEMVGKRYRVIVSSLHMCTWAMFSVILAAVAYMIRDAFHLQLALFTPSLFFILWYWYVPESPRWLLFKERHDEFKDLVRTIAQCNGKSHHDIQWIDENKLIEKDNVPDDSKASCLMICTDPYILFISVVQAYLWFTTSATYYGLSLNATSLGGNDYLDTFISGAVEVPAYLSTILIYAKIGRKRAAFTLLSISAIAVFSTAFIHARLVTLILVVTSVGKFCVTVLFNMVYLYTAELYPTSVRAMGLSISSFFARIGSMLAPFAVELGMFYPGLPMILFGLVCCVAALSTLSLPETKGTTLPQNFEDVRDLPNTCRCCVRSQNTDKSRKSARNGETLQKLTSTDL